MAKLEQGILGHFRGKVGSVVGYVWRGRQVVRAYRREINYPNTENQRLEREWFVSMVRFAATARQALLLGLRERAARDQMTEGNAFVKMNKHCFGRERIEKKEKIETIETIESINSIKPIDYQSLVLSEGPAAPVRFAAATLDDGGVLRVAFGKNSGLTCAKGGDRVYLYIYSTATRQGLLSAPAGRRDGTLSVQLPDGWNQLNTRLWGFVVDTEGRASHSAHIGWAAPENGIPMEEEIGDIPVEKEEKKGVFSEVEKTFLDRNMLIIPPLIKKSEKSKFFFGE